jgi:hypothetical protein
MLHYSKLYPLSVKYLKTLVGDKHSSLFRLRLDKRTDNFIWLIWCFTDKEEKKFKKKLIKRLKV